MSPDVALLPDDIDLLKAMLVAAGAELDAYWDNAGHRAGIVDDYRPIHTDPRLGVAGACPSASPFGAYFVDGVHLTGRAGYPGTPSGQPYFANWVQARLAA